MSATATPERAAQPHDAPARAHGRLPVIVAAAGVALVGLLALVFNLRIHGFILDETLIKQSAVHYSHGLPGSLRHDLTARSTSRLYSLVISPLFAAFHGDVGVRAARGLNGPLFASTAIPVYLLARQVLVSRWAAPLAALAAVALPWLTLTTAMFTENLAYPLALWSVCAMAWSFRSPSPLRDGLVVVAIGLATGTRAQLGALAFGYAALIAWRLWLDRPRSRPRAAAWLRAGVRAFPVTSACLVLGVLVLMVLLANGTLGDRLSSLSGAYSPGFEARDKAVPLDYGLGLAVEVLALSVGVGFVPALLAFGWWPRAAAGRLGEDARGVAAAIGCAVIALFAITLYIQGGWQAQITEERYYFYAAPLLWIGALAALESRCVDRRDLLEAGLALTLIAALVTFPRTLDLESSYFAPVMSGTRYLAAQAQTLFSDVTGRGAPSPADLLAFALLVATLALAALWRRPRVIVVGLGVAAAVQLVLVAVPFAAIDGRIAGVPGRVSGPPYAQLGFIDRATGDQAATWITSLPRPADGSADLIEHIAGVYNDSILRRADVPQLGLLTSFPLNALPLSHLQLAPDGRATVTPALPTPFAVARSDSPLMQLDGAVVARNRSLDLDVLRLGPAPRLRWLATGLAADGTVEPAGAQLRSWGSRHVVLTLRAGRAPAEVRIAFGRQRRSLTVPARQRASVPFDLCGDASGRLSTSGASVTLDTVASTPGRC